MQQDFWILSCAFDCPGWQKPKQIPQSPEIEYLRKQQAELSILHKSVF